MPRSGCASVCLLVRAPGSVGVRDEAVTCRMAGSLASEPSWGRLRTGVCGPLLGPPQWQREASCTFTGPTHTCPCSPEATKRHGLVGKKRGGSWLAGCVVERLCSAVRRLI